MAQDQRDLSGILFKNDRMREGKNDAPYSGSCTINGVQYWMNAWVKDGAKGKFFSFSFRAKDASTAAPAPRKNTGAPEDYPPKTDDDSVPF